jgi:hypothetical protein
MEKVPQLTDSKEHLTKVLKLPIAAAQEQQVTEGPFRDKMHVNP